MTSRLNLQTMLESIINSPNVYYQPPPSVKMDYPAIVYSRKIIDNTYASNSVYEQSMAYTVTVIDKNPDSDLVGKISLLPTCKHDRHFMHDNLNHDVFTLYF